MTTDYLKYARQLLQKHSRDEVKNLLLSEVKNDKDLALHLLRLGADQLVRDAKASSTRGASDEAAPAYAPGPRQETHDPIIAGKIAKQRYMDGFYLFGTDMTAAKATAKDWAKSANEYRTMAEGHMRAEAFARDMAKILEKSGKTTEQVFKDEVFKEKAKLAGIC